VLDFTSLPPAFPPQMIAAIPPQSLPLPSVMAGPESSPAALPEPALLTRLDDLCLRFALPVADGAAREALAREAEVLQRHGLAELGYLGCAAACLARIEDMGGVLVSGLWAGSALLACVGAVVPELAEVASSGELVAAFLAAVERDEMPVLRLLVAAVPRERFLARLQALSATHLLPPQVLIGGRVRLALGGPSAATSPLLELIPSQLFELLRGAIGWADQLADMRIDLLDITNYHAGATALLSGEWPSLLPVVPPGLPLAAPVDGLGALIARQSADAAGLPLDARVGLAVHLALAWGLAAITAAYPAAGWVALLEELPPATLASGVRAAVRAGIPTLLSSVAWSEDRWAVEMAEGRWALRPGLASIPVLGTLAGAIVHDRAAKPYTSLFDLLRRVPALANEPRLALRLVLEGALDDLHDRRMLLSHWPEIAVWCARSTVSPAGTERDDRMADDLPDLARPGALPEQQLAAWAQAFAPIPDVEPPATIEDALLPFAVRDAVVGARLRVAGAVRAARVLQSTDGDDGPMALVELTDGRASVRALLAIRDGEPALPAEGAWLVLDLVVAERDGHRLLVQDSLAAARVSIPIGVSVPVRGDREADLARLLAVRAILARHPGVRPAQVALLDGGRRRVLQLGELRVRWGEPLRCELESLLGSDMAGPLEAE